MIGIFGGTFDPVHRAHVQVARDVLQGLGLSEVRFVPCWQPVHRNAPQASATDRVAMLEIALANEDGLNIDTQEIDRKGPSYMFDTLMACQQEQPDTPLALILGSDAFAHFQSWHRWQSILDIAHIVVMVRPDFSPEWPEPLRSFVSEHQIEQNEGLSEQNHGRILIFPVTQIMLSSTDVRQRLTAGDHCTADLPDGVIELIQRQNLYQ